MNTQLIEKVILCSSQTCPDFIYSNPILDRNVAQCLAKSFVKILSQSKHNSSINNNLRLSILDKIRKMCQTEPQDHIKVDENMTSILTEFYFRHLNETNMSNFNDPINKHLDDFLVRRLKQLNVNSRYTSNLNPELVQALINLNEDHLHLETLYKNILQWNSESGKHMTILQDLWKNIASDNTFQTSKILDDISIKMKSEIEQLLLSISINILSQRDTSIEAIFQCNNEVKSLIKKCSKSVDCFQICIGILNSLFIMTNFDSRMQTFVWMFVTNVKQTSEPTFSILYPIALSHIVVLMDFDLEVLTLELKDKYIQTTLKYLQSLHSCAENDLILLLSHFPQWFDIYFSKTL